jgi:hypothetical protein
LPTLYLLLRCEKWPGVAPQSAFFHRDAEGAQKVYILRVKCFVCGRTFIHGRLELRGWLLFHFVQANRCLQHEQYIKPLFSDVLHNFRDLLRFGNRFVNGFTQLLDETTKSLVQVLPPIGTMRRGFPYLTCDDGEDQSESTG